MVRWSWVAVGAAVIAVYNVTLAVLSLAQRDELLLGGQREAEIIAATLTAQIEDTFDVVDHTLSGIAEVLAVAPSIQADGDYLHRLLIRRHAITPVLKSLVVIDSGGQLLATSSAKPVPAINLADRDYFQAYRDSVRDDMFIGAPVRSRLDGHWIIPISRAQESSYGTLTAVVASSINPEHFAARIEALRPPKGFRIAIRLPLGHMVACVGFSGCALENPPEVWPVAGNHGSDSYAAYLPGGSGPGAFGRGEKYGVVSIAMAERAALLKPWSDSLPLSLGLSVLGTMGTVVGLVILRRQMAARQQAMADLAQANAALEVRVSERTSELADSEDRLRSFIRAARDAIVIIDERGLVTEFNPSACELFGYLADEVLGRSVNMLMPSAYAQDHDRHLGAAHRKGERPVGAERQMIGRRRNGQEFPIELTVGTRIISGRAYHVGVIRDITERKANEDTLRRLANQDGLTGILNRRSFMEEGDLLFAIAQRHQRDLSVLMIDADHFKSVNDTHGHDIGDIVLKVLATTVGARLRDTDIFGRLGGEEFAAVLPETNAAGAEAIGWSVVEAVRDLEVALPAGGALRFTVSVGVGTLDQTSKSLADLLKTADTCLYEAKKSGRNRVVMVAATV